MVELINLNNKIRSMCRHQIVEEQLSPQCSRIWLFNSILTIRGVVRNFSIIFDWILESIVPIGYFALQISCLVVIIKGGYDTDIFGSNFTTIALLYLKLILMVNRLSTVATVVLYCSSAFMNPGYVLGNHSIDSNVFIIFA